MNANKILIYGVSGSGKTYFSKKLGKQLGLPVFEADKIKDKLRETKKKEEYPFIYLGTCQAYRYFGELNKENVIKGLLSVREALNQAVIDELQKHDQIIMEGAFFDPDSLKNLGRVILLTTIDEKRHRKQFLSHREKMLDIKNNQFKAARIIQGYLIEEAKSLGLEIIDSNNL